MAACFASHGRSFLTLRFFCQGAAAADCCARLRVARANRAVTIFAMFRFVFLPTLFSGLCRVRFGHSATLHSLRSHRKTLFIPSKSRLVLKRSIPLRSILLLRPCRHLLCPQKNYTSQQKIAPALRQAVGVHSLHYVTAICVRHPRSTRRRLAPDAAAKKCTPFRYAPFRSIFNCCAQGCFTCVVLCYARAQPPTTHP